MGPGAADEDTQTASGNASPVDAGAPQEPAHPETAADLEGASSSGLSHLSEDELPPLGLEANSLGPSSVVSGSVVSGSVGPLSESAPLARPSFVFFGVVAGLSLAADIASKV